MRCTQLLATICALLPGARCDLFAATASLCLALPGIHEPEYLKSRLVELLTLHAVAPGSTAHYSDLEDLAERVVEFVVGTGDLEEQLETAEVSLAGISAPPTPPEEHVQGAVCTFHDVGELPVSAPCEEISERDESAEDRQQLEAGLEHARVFLSEQKVPRNSGEAQDLLKELAEIQNSLKVSRDKKLLGKNKFVSLRKQLGSLKNALSETLRELEAAEATQRELGKIKDDLEQIPKDVTTRPVEDEDVNRARAVLDRLANFEQGAGWKMQKEVEYLKIEYSHLTAFEPDTMEAELFVPLKDLAQIAQALMLRVQNFEDSVFDNLALPAESELGSLENNLDTLAKVAKLLRANALANPTHSENPILTAMTSFAGVKQVLLRHFDHIFRPNRELGFAHWKSELQTAVTAASDVLMNARKCDKLETSDVIRLRYGIILPYAHVAIHAPIASRNDQNLHELFEEASELANAFGSVSIDSPAMDTVRRMAEAIALVDDSKKAREKLKNRGVEYQEELKRQYLRMKLLAIHAGSVRQERTVFKLQYLAAFGVAKRNSAAVDVIRNLGGRQGGPL